MNRYEAQGVARDVEDGLRVIYLSSGDACRSAFEGVEREISDASKVLRAYGRQFIEHESGGWVRFVRTGGGASGIRGVACDVVVVGGPGRDDMDLVSSAIVSLQGSAVGELIRSC